MSLVSFELKKTYSLLVEAAFLIHCNRLVWTKGLREGRLISQFRFHD